MKKTYTYPRNKRTGSIPQYVEAWDLNAGEIEWLEPAPIPIAKLMFQDFERGRSAAHAVFIVETPNTFISRFTVFLTDLGDIIRQGSLEGRWWTPPSGFVMPCKRGSNYGIRALTPAEVQAMTKAAVQACKK